jgi:16S rRNA processing protein RimM
LRSTRGNRGELFAEIYSGQPGRAERLQNVRLDKDGASRLAQVERVWLHNGRPVLKFAGVDSITDAEKLQGSDVLVEEAERERPGEGEYSHEDLIGCTVMSDGQPAGVVRSVEDYGGTPLLKLEAADGREILVPFARAICVEIDVSAKVIRARLPEGLTEL